MRGLNIWLAAMVAFALALSCTALAQSVQPAELQPGRIVGTVTDANNDIVPQAKPPFSMAMARTISAESQSVTTVRIEMFRANIRWLENGPILKVQGKLVAHWAEQARSLVTRNVVPKGLIVDVTDVSYVDSAGEQLLKCLANVGAVFVARNAYARAMCERLHLSSTQTAPQQSHRSKEAKSFIAQGTQKERNCVLVSIDSRS